jgi:hypothetical protein
MNELASLHSIYPNLDASLQGSESLYLLRLAEVYGDGLLEEYLETLQGQELRETRKIIPVPTLSERYSRLLVGV